MPKYVNFALLSCSVSRAWLVGVMPLNLTAWGLGAYTIYERNIGLYATVWIVNTTLAVVEVIAHLSANPEVISAPISSNFEAFIDFPRPRRFTLDLGITIGIQRMVQEFRNAENRSGGSCTSRAATCHLGRVLVRFCDILFKKISKFRTRSVLRSVNLRHTRTL